jgi:hypothetical protein
VSRRGCFFYGNAISPFPSSSASSASSASSPSQQGEALVTALCFPRLVAIHTGHLDVSACEYTAEGTSQAAAQAAAASAGEGDGGGGDDDDGDSDAPSPLSSAAATPAAASASASRPEADKEGAGRVVAYRASGSPLCFTLECNYNTGKFANPVPPPTNDGGRSTPPTAGTASARGLGGGRASFA